MGPYFKDEEREFHSFEEKEKPQPDLSAVFNGSQALEKAPEIKGVPTGIEGLDDLFSSSTKKTESSRKNL